MRSANTDLIVYIPRKTSSAQMWLPLLAALLQVFLIIERIMFRFFLLFVFSRRSDVKRLADNTVLGSVTGGFIFYCTLPFQAVIRIMNAVMGNMVLYAFIIALCCTLLLLCQNGTSFLVGYVHTYNSGIGQSIDLILQLLQIPNILIKYSIPLYNMGVYLISQLLKYVLLPFTGVHLNEFPALIENLTMALTALVLSLNTFVSNLFGCTVSVPVRNNNSIVFMPTETQCYANVNHYQFDLMTPGIYVRKSSISVKDMLTTSCGPVTVLIELLMFPLLDFNLYKCVHCLVNSVLHLIIVMPVMTYKRCKYGEETQLSAMEKSVMCVPDFGPQHAMATSLFRSLGRFLDNWLNIAYALSEKAILGSVTNQCDQVDAKRMNLTRAGELFSVPVSNLKVVGMTDNLFAVTDGQSTEYHSSTDMEETEMAVGNWPFAVNVAYGVAAVQHGETNDMDAAGDTRSGLFGCQCVDVPLSDRVSMEIWCASVPHTVHHDNETEYNTATTHRINFQTVSSNYGMSCSTVKIKVSTLRFSQKRFSRGYTSNSMDGDYLDAFNTLGTSGQQQPRTFSADAAIYVQPLCGDGTSSMCIPNADNCFPWCMGMHIAGQSGQNITVYNAQRWDGYVNMRQVDCAVSLATDTCVAESAGFMANEEFNIHGEPICSNACMPDHNSESFLLLTNSSAEDNTFLRQKNLRPTVRLDHQPLVVAGDIMLVKDGDQLVVNRVFDNSRGFFSIQGQHLTLTSNAETISMISSDCTVLADEECYSNAALRNQIIEPPGYELNPLQETPTAVSEFGVHWAVNPPNSVLGDRYDLCAGKRLDANIVTSSYTKARVWTLRPVRSTSAEGISDTGLVSYMVIPDWMQEDTPCEEVVNQKVVDLEYINAENVLVTVYRTSPKYYDWRIGSACDGCPFEYAMYYLHPNRQDCVEPSESDGTHFSCWQSISKGMFKSPDFFVSDVIGSMCPGMQKMPKLGSMATEVGVASMSMIKITLDMVTVIPAAWRDLPGIFKQPRTELTFHTVLDSSGATFLDVEIITTSLDRAVMLAAHVLPKLGNLMRDQPGYTELQPRLIGTAKILQYHPRLYDRVLTGPFLYQLKTLSAVPTGKILDMGSDLTKSVRISALMLNFQNLLRTTTSTVTLNSRLTRVMLLRLLLRNIERRASISNVITSSLYEMQAEFDRSYFESMRVQCDGFGQFVGRDVWGNALKQTCLIVPSTLKAVLRALMVFLVEYRTMDCVCRMSTEMQTVEYVKQLCLPEDRPVAMQAFTLNFMKVAFDSKQEMCFAYMDAANNELIRAFDPVFNHMYQATVNLGSSLDYILGVFDVDAGNCANFQTSPYVMTLLPDPSDYFLGCVNTFDCRAKCLDTYTAFETALNAMTTVPVQTLTSSVEVNSRFFSIDDVENGNDSPPFEIYGMLELSGAACKVVCSQGGEVLSVHDRCIVVAGILQEIRLGLAYYCLPHNFMDSVFEFHGDRNQFEASVPFYQDRDMLVTETINNIYIMTVDSVLQGRHEMLLVATQSKSDDIIQTLWVFNSEGDKFLLMQTSVFDPDVVDEGGMHDIASVRVRPGIREENIRHSAVVYVKGTRFVINSDDEVVEHTVCMTYSVVMYDLFEGIDIGVSENQAFQARIVKSFDPDYACNDALYDDDRKMVCFDKYCDQHLRIPLSVATDVKLRMRVVATGQDDEYEFSDPQSNIAKLLALDPSYALIRTGEGHTHVNRKFVSDYSPRAPTSCSSATALKECLNLIVVGRLSAGHSWLHNVYLTLDNTNKQASSEITEGVKIPQRITTTIDCAIDSCAGCADDTRSAASVDLQNKCYAASLCAVSNCVGTKINLKRPLCNLGNTMSASMDVVRVALHGMWISVAHMIVIAVELSAARRDQYRLTFPQDIFMSYVCNAKDATVESVSVLTSIGGGVMALVHDKSVPGMSYDANEAAIDVRVHGKQMLFMAALTQFLSAFMMAPLYATVAMQKTLDCRVDSFLVIMNRITSEAAGVEILRGSQDQDDATDDLVGMCMSKYGDASALDSDGGMDRVGALVGQMMTDVRSMKRSYFFEPWIHGIDAGIAWMQGIVTGAMDMAQIIDWSHCKLPVTSTQRRGLCVCGDQAMRIPSVQRQAKVGHGSHGFWCSGPLLLANVDGSDLLVWNPYSLEQLLNPVAQGGAGNYDEFLDCLSTGKSDCEAKKPRLPVLSAQGAEVLQVVTRCRANYQQMTWDEGVLTLGLYDYDTWQGTPASLSSIQQTSSTGPIQRQVKRLTQVSQFITPEGGEIVDTSTLRCLRQAAEAMTGHDQCMRDYFSFGSSDWQSVNAYFTYEPFGVTSTFTDIDSCQAFSGDMGFINSNTQLSYPLIVWTGNSNNKVPVSTYHLKSLGSESTRQTTALQELEELLSEEILPELLKIDPSLSDQITTESWSMEGDNIHQLVDCIMLGPYASADMQSSFDIVTGQRLPVQSYHRGNSESRQFMPDNNQKTGGSDARKHIIQTAQNMVDDSWETGLRQTFLNKFNLIKEMYGNIENLLCLCPGTNEPSITCCTASTVEELHYKAKDTFPNVYDIKEEMQEFSLAQLVDTDVLKRGVWNDEKFSYLAPPFSSTDREELLDKFVFDYSKPVLEYSSNEIMTNFTQKTLWHRCMELISMSFFTMPLKAGDSMDVDASMTYDPTTGSAAYLHGMEAAIERILERARRDSPVFWTHVHRYMPTESVWCESLTDDPIVTTEPSDVPYARNKWKTRSEDPIRGHTLDETVFVGGLPRHCVCGWNDGSVCQVPDCWSVNVSDSLGESWQELCSRGTYTSRKDLFTFLQVIQETEYFDPVWFESCNSVIPSVTWGLLDSTQHKSWFEGSTQSYNIDMQEVATTGPAGIRLGLLGQSENSLLAWVKRHNLLQRDPAHSPFNFFHNHTIAQPYCQGNADLWHVNLTQYFRDVFFPMAHSVHTSAVGSYCSTWAIEYAIETALLQVYRDANHGSVLEQTARVDKWKERCDIQLQQIGICNLRGVFDLEPTDPRQYEDQCDFSVHTEHGCDTIMYVTPNCLVMCDGEFYDPCDCSSNTNDCTAVNFQKHQCTELRFDPREFADTEDVKLYSMHWPSNIMRDENNDLDTTAIDAELTEIRSILSKYTFESDELLLRIKEIILADDAEQGEGSAPNAFCDDLEDYFDGNAQHPVGYHPTTACMKERTRMRGFASWMSTSSDTAWTVDPVRLRNMTLYSTTFGTSHLVCDGAVYGAQAYQLNPFYLNTRWDADQAVDPAVPLQPEQPTVTSMRMIGTPSQKSTDTTIISSDQILRHSVGLIRDWFRYYGDDGSIQDELNAMWPNWVSEVDADHYGLAGDDPLVGCPMPPLRTCENDDDCAGGSVNMVCLLPPTLNGSVMPGICELPGKCYQHEHCPDELMCSGQGECLQPYIIFNNRDTTPVNVQLFAQDSAQCQDSMYGISEGQGVSEFAHHNGMCSMRNWYMYQNMTHNVEPTGRLRLVNGRRQFSWPEGIEDRSAIEENILHTTAHPCDRSYHHSLNYCSPGHFSASTIGSDEPVEVMTGVRTRQKDDYLRFCDMPNSDHISGFLNPYQYYSGEGKAQHTLAFVPETVSHCDDFRQCPELKFLVDGHSVRRKVITNLQQPTVHRHYYSNDADSCFGAGYRDDPQCMTLQTCTCVVDRWSVPLIDGLFSTDTTHVSTETSLSDTDIRQMYDDVHGACDVAFSNNIAGDSGFDLFKRYLHVLTRTYSSENRETVTMYANTLLPSFFGIDVTGDSNSNRGIKDVDDYVGKVKCANKLHEVLDKASDVVKNSERQAYPVESTVQERAPGRTMYFFHERAPVMVQFDWFWKCVVLAENDFDGGADFSWFSQLTDPSNKQSLTCSNFEYQADGPTTLKKRLQTDRQMYTFYEQDSNSDNPLLEQINDVVAFALSELKLTMLPNLECAECLSNCATGSERDLFHENSCWVKTGFDSSQTRVEQTLSQPDGSTAVSLYRHVYLKLLGNENPAFQTVETLKQSGLITQATLDMEVSATQNFFPVNVFAALTDMADPTTVYPVSPFDFSDSETDCVSVESFLRTNQYLQDDSDCANRLMKYEFEFVDRNPRFIRGSNRKYLTMEQAQYEVLQVVRREIYNSATLRSTTLLEDDTLSRNLFAVTQSSPALRASKSWNHYMTEKSFICTDGAELRSAETNQAHTRLRECVQALKENIGWKVNQRVKLDVYRSMLNRSFFPTFSEPFADTFLDDLTGDWTDESVAPSSHRICFRDTRNGEVHIMSPLWAGDFDVTSCPTGMACGCDTMLNDDNTRVVDTRCSTGQRCEADFPEFYEMLHRLTASHCVDLATTLQPVAMRRDGSLADDQIPLCKRSVNVDSCDIRFGSLHGHQGSKASSLYPGAMTPPTVQEGLFEISNSIFRRRTSDRFVPDLGVHHPVAMRIKNTDIGGHGLEFGIDSHGDMHLDCVHLGNTHARCGTEQSNAFVKEQHNWLANVENEWSWRQNTYVRAWDPAYREPPMDVSWKCPLQWWSAYSNHSKSFAARSPNPQRNKIRFQHITGTHGYDHVHPVVQSVRRMSKLKPARFMADNRACKHSLASSCQTPVTPTIDDMYKMADGEWVSVSLDGTMDDAVVDWPHTLYYLFDDKNIPHGTEPEVSVLDRLPPFAIRYEQRQDPLPLESTRSATVEPAGVCRMQRLPRFNQMHESWSDDCFIQMCTQEEGGLRCKYTNGSVVDYITFSFVDDPASTRDTHTTSRHRRCDACDVHGGEFQDRSLKRTPLLSGPSASMSVGTPIRIKTERLVARYIRSHVCPVATEDACPELGQVFDSTKWTSGEFLRELLEADSESSLFQQSWINRSQADSSNQAVNDDSLWQRSWVFCDQTKTDNSRCRGSISKQEWLNPDTRHSRCLATVLEESRKVDETPVQFCLLDDNTQALCELVAGWNQRITQILCRAAGLSSCPDYGFFYAPTTFAVENQQFVSDTVQDFYTTLDDSKCVASTPDGEEIRNQIDSNNQERSKCASVQLEVVRELLDTIRGAVGFMWRMVYFAMMMGAQVTQIVLGAVMGPAGSGLINQALGNLVKYTGLLMESISSFLNLLLDAAWKLLVESGGSFGNVMKKILQAVCVIVNIIKSIICAIIKDILNPTLKVIADVIGVFNGGAKDKLNKSRKEMVAMAEVKICTPMVCDLTYLNAADDLDGTLPVPTRCWSSYLTFYGDSDALSCSRADSCRSSLLDNTRVVCAQCSASGPGYKQFGCEPATKLCTCNVQDYQRTPCLSNDQCRVEGATCSYLLSDLSVSDGSTPCETCQTERVCYLNIKTGDRFCACGLFPVQFSTCEANALTATVFPESSKLCLYQPDSKFSRSLTFSVRGSALLSTPCMDVDVSMSYCMRDLERAQNVIVALSVSSARRRLLGMDAELTFNITRNSLCRDALRSDSLPETRNECLEAVDHSRKTVRLLRLNASSECMFCSFDDLWYEVTRNPALLQDILARPTVWLTIMSRHGPGRGVGDFIRTGLRWTEVSVHSLVSDYDFATLVNSTVIQGRLSFERDGRTVVTSSGSARHLLGLEEIVQRVEERFGHVYNIHQEYATQLASAFDYNYADEPDAASEWRYRWPPVIDISDEDVCDTVKDTLMVVRDIVNVTAQPYLKANLQSNPAKSLRDSWPKLTNYSNDSGHNATFHTPSIIDTAGDWVEEWFVKLLRGVLDLMGVKVEDFYNLYFSVVKEVKNMAKCDFYAVQTCSQWRVKMVHGMVIVSCYMSIWLLFWNSVRLPLVAAMTTPLFAILLMYVCYGYSPLCVPMVPICFFEDLLQTMRYLFPKFLVIPQAMIRTDVTPACKPNQLLPRVECVKSCDVEPFHFTSWEPVFAVVVAEIGGSLQKFVTDNLEWIPLVDIDTLRRLIEQKSKVIEYGDSDMVVAQRICAGLNSWRLAPYIMLLLGVGPAVVAMANLLPLVITPLLQIVTSLYVSVFTE